MENNFALDFDTPIDLDAAGESFILLDEGEYDGEICSFERGEFPGSSKLPEAPKAVITVKVDTPKGSARIKSDIILVKSLEWKIALFAKACGMNGGGKAVIKWDKLVGTRVRVKVTQREYESRGETRKTNEIDRWLPAVSTDDDDF